MDRLTGTAAIALTLLLITGAARGNDLIIKKDLGIVRGVITEETDDKYVVKIALPGDLSIAMDVMRDDILKVYRNLSDDEMQLPREAILDKLNQPDPDPPVTPAADPTAEPAAPPAPADAATEAPQPGPAASPAPQTSPAPAASTQPPAAQPPAAQPPAAPVAAPTPGSESILPGGRDVVRSNYASYFEDKDLQAAQVFRPMVSSKASVSRISNELLPVIPPSLPTGRCREVTANNLNMRRGPSTNYEKVGVALPGSILRILDEEDGWYLALSETGQEGWVFGQYTRPLENKPVVVTGALVNFRATPSTAGQRIGRLARGEILMMLRVAFQTASGTARERKEEDDYWIQARTADGQVGWLSASYAALAVNEVVLTPRIYRRTNLQPEGHFTVESKGDSSGWAKRAELTVTDKALVRNGMASLVVLYSGQIDTPTATLALIGTLDEKDLVSRRTYRESDLPELGFESELIRYQEGAVLAVLKGQKKGDAWVYEIGVSDAAPVSTAQKPLDLVYGLVVQDGENRGAFIPFDF